MSVLHLRQVLVLGTAVLLTSFTLSSANAKDSTGQLRLSAEGLAGTTAIRALGNNLASVAAQHGKTANQLRRMLLSDKTLKVSRKGRLYYIEDAAQVPSRPTPEDTILNGALLPLDQTFNLHSRPGSNRSLILNFQGKTVTGTYWNTIFGRASFVASPFTLDGDPATFSDAERAAIQQIWQRVAEDYAPFDVDVTTDINVPTGALYATAVITRQSDYFGSAPGIAFVSTFGNSSYDPAFVAYDTLYRNPKYIAEAISHELGHRLGLDHDGTRTSAYYAGHGTAPAKWAPIMGNSYAANVTQFSKGEYSNANNPQDDFLVMTRFVPLKTDNAADLQGQSTALPATSSNGQTRGMINGVIETQGDADLYTITAGAGLLTATVAPAAIGPNADLSISLLNDAGTALATSAPSTSLGGAVSFTLAQPGTYYLRVGATGNGAAAATGYSDYGSRGLYRLSASYATAASTAPTAVINAAPAAGLAPLTVSFAGTGAGGTGRLASYAWKLGNGTSASTATARATYTQPGVYVAQLKVTDGAGFSGSAVKEVVVGKAFTTATLTVTRVANPDGSYSASANINGIADSTGRKLAPVNIYGTWSGAVQGPAQTSRYLRSGATFTSPASSNANACFTFTIDRVDAVDPASNSQKPVAWFTQAPRSVSTCPQQAAR